MGRTTKSQVKRARHLVLVGFVFELSFLLLCLEGMEEGNEEDDCREDDCCCDCSAFDSCEGLLATESGEGRKDDSRREESGDDANDEWIEDGKGERAGYGRCLWDTGARNCRKPGGVAVAMAVVHGFGGSMLRRAVCACPTWLA